jgi:ATP-dependent Clp protease ATP-binding subunit ClpA
MRSVVVPAEEGVASPERFTPGALAVIERAREEARGLEHRYVGQEHLLVALAYDPASTSARALSGAGVTAKRARAAVVEVVGRGGGGRAADAAITRRAQKALDLALDEARRLNHYHLGTGHLLLGLLRERTGIAGQLLTLLGVDPEALRESVLGLLSERADQDPWLKRYQLVVPSDLFDAVQRIAAREEATVIEVLRRFIRLGLLVTEMQQRPGAALIVRDEDGERQLLLV